MAPRPVVLIVDDEPDIANSVAEIVHLDLQYEALTAGSAEEGLAILRSMEHTPPDLLIVDFRMPRMDGIQFLKNARTILPDIPAMMVTAYADLDLVMRATRELHLARFLRKPIKAEALVAAVKDLVAPRWMARQRQAAFARSTR